jgi:broad specificity phosphatase PhoE
MTRLVLIRHGETDWNVEGRYQGQADPPLNDKGWAQARQLAQELQGVGIDVLYTSPLRRARQTAEILAEEQEIPLHVEPRLVEIHQGDWQTRLRAEIENLYPHLFHRWQTEPWEVTPPQGEHLSQVQKRVGAAVEEILARHPGEKVGLVAHRIPIALIKVRYQAMSPDIVRTLHLPNVYWEELVIREK